MNSQRPTPNSLLIPAGYQRTVVGIIPVDWEIIRLGNIGSVIRGASPRPKGDKRFYGGAIPRLMVEDVTRDGKFVVPQVDFLTVEGAKRSRPCKKGTLTIVCSGTVGVVSFLKVDACIHDGFLALVKIAKYFHDNYLYHQLNRLREEFDHSATHGGVFTNLTTFGVRDFRITMPPTLTEQKAIAGALSDADGWIEALERLVAKKRALKQATMQQLLTGKKRLPGFSGEWVTKRLGDVITHCSSGATPYRGRPEFYTGNIRWISSGELNYNWITDTIEKITPEAVALTNLCIHPVGTFLIAITGLEAAGTRGACGFVGSPSATNQSCMAIYPTHDLSVQFLFWYYIFRGDQLALEYCQGTKQQSYTAKLIKILPIEMPVCVEEQRAIAEVLTDMDTEITALKAKLTKARQIKQGMMQELLTGRIRLVESDQLRVESKKRGVNREK